MADSVMRYQGESVEVTFDGQRCLHAARCVSGLPAVFDRKRRPWVLPDRAPAEHVAAVVRRCPTGALHYRLVDGDPEAPATPTQVSARDREPLWLRGDLRIDTGEGPVAETRAAMCRCGATANAPFCDGAGNCRGWHERVAELDGSHNDGTPVEDRDELPRHAK